MMDSLPVNVEHRQHNNQNQNRPVSFAGIGLDEVDGAASYLNSNGRPATSSSSSKGGGGRQLTFRDYGEKIKELEGENFQLKVRLHLIEQAKYGKNRTAIPQQGQQNSSASQDGLTVATNEIVSEFQQLKKENEALNLKLVTAENQRIRLEEERQEILQREQEHLSRNEELNRKLDILDRELALVKLKKDEEEDEIEKCVKAFNSFGGGGGNGNSTSYNNNNHLSNPTLEQNNILQAANDELDTQIKSLKHTNDSLLSNLVELQNINRQKGAENEKLHQKLQKRTYQMTKLKEENYEINVKLNTTCETMKDMGFQFNDKKSQNKHLLAENEMLKQSVSSHSAAYEQAQHEINHLKRENALLNEKVSMSEKLHREYGKLVTELKTLRAVCPVDETYERFVTVGLTRSVSHQELREDPSPDLGIETDHEALAQQLGSLNLHMVPESSNSSKISSKKKPIEECDRDELIKMNKNLAYKLKHTRQALDTSVTKLQKTTKEKEEFGKAVCRQLHRTHNLLEDAQQSLEKEHTVEHMAQAYNNSYNMNANMIDHSVDQLPAKNCNFVFKES